MTVKRKTGLILLAVLLALGSCWIVYVNDFYPADEAALEAMAVSETVTVLQEEGRTVFCPESPEAGFVFYPGGKVEYTAYAPLMRRLAERKVLCVLLEMPCNLAVLDMDAAEGIPEQFPEVGNWYIGGHSLGGSMAAAYAADNADKYAGLILLAAYSTADLRDTGLEVLCLYGSEDGVMNREAYEGSYANLPPTTQTYVIEGGNHAGFGSYGPQQGDGTAEITGDTQLQITAERIAALMLGA